MKDGQYYYAPHRRLWGVWQYKELPSGGYTGEFVKDFVKKEDARKMVFSLNKWFK